MLHIRATVALGFARPERCVAASVIVRVGGGVGRRGWRRENFARRVRRCETAVGTRLESRQGAWECSELTVAREYNASPSGTADPMRPEASEGASLGPPVRTTGEISMSPKSSGCASRTACVLARKSSVKKLCCCL